MVKMSIQRRRRDLSCLTDPTPAGVPRRDGSGRGIRANRGRGCGMGNGRGRRL